MLSVSVQDALAAALVDEGMALLDAPGGTAPLSVKVWLSDRTAAGKGGRTATAAAAPSRRSADQRWCAAADVRIPDITAGSTFGGG